MIQNITILQSSILGLTLFKMFKSVVPHPDNTNFATHADDTILISTNVDLTRASELLQTHLNELQN